MTNIDEAKARLRKIVEVDEARRVLVASADIATVLDALDAVECERDEHKFQEHGLRDDIGNLEHERDDAIREMHARELHHFEEEQRSAELAAVIEKAIAYVRASWLGNGEPTRDTPAGEIIAILAAVPTDALRAVKAEVWDEGQQAEAEAQFQDAGYGNVQHPDNPYRIEKGGADRWTVN